MGTWRNSWPMSGEAQQRTACGPSALAQRTEALYFGAGEWQRPARRASVFLHGKWSQKKWHETILDHHWSPGFVMICHVLLMFGFFSQEKKSFGESLGVSPTFTIIYPPIIILIDRVATCNCSPLIYLLYLTSPPIGLLLPIFAIQRFKNLVDGRPNRPFEVFWHWCYEITITLFLHSW